jgi:hypothetical protein
VSAPRKSSLVDTHPEIAAQANGWDSSNVSTFSNKKLQWKCELGHEWTATVASRSNGIGCPICSNQQVLAGYNDLATTHPEVAAQADGWDPRTVTTGSSKKLDWICSENHVWSTSPYKRVNGSGCPVCSGNKVLAGFNDLATTHPEIAKQADGWDPRTISKGSNKKLRWKCINNHVWTATTNSRTSGIGCPICSNQQVLAGYNDLATTHPEIAAQADGWDPAAVTRGHKSKRSWVCELGHKWESTVSGRTGKGSGCPICSNQLVHAGYNDLATVNPTLASQADGWDPQTVSPNARATLAWKCDKGHKWKSAVHSRASGIGCPYCSNKKVLAGYNDLASTHPELAAEADGWDPTKLSFGIGKKVKWICSFNHSWEASPNTRTKSGCPVCAGRVVVQGFNDLESINPLLASEADGWDPKTYTSSSSKIVGWVCEEGHKWKAAIYSRTAGNDCPSCAKFGFKPKESAWLYLLESEELELLQLGITNNPEERLAKHKRSGFGIVRDLRGPIDGYLARDLERSCIQTLVKRGAIFANKLDVKQFDGWTESWTSKSLDTSSFKQLLDWVYEDDGNATHKK